MYEVNLKKPIFELIVSNYFSLRIRTDISVGEIVSV